MNNKDVMKILNDKLMDLAKKDVQVLESMYIEKMMDLAFLARDIKSRNIEFTSLNKFLDGLEEMIENLENLK